MAEPVRARRLSEDEGRRLQAIVRRGKHGSIRVRRALIVMASASGTPVPAIARLVAADEDKVRDVIHAFNARGLNALDPQWAGGRPRLISDADMAVIVTTATIRPKQFALQTDIAKLVRAGAIAPGTQLTGSHLGTVVQGSVEDEGSISIGNGKPYGNINEAAGPPQASVKTAWRSGTWATRTGPPSGRCEIRPVFPGVLPPQLGTPTPTGT
jgi:hypothetical protein